MADGTLVFSDIPASTVYQWVGGDSVRVFRRPSGRANGIARSPGGDLLLAQHDGRVSRITSDGREVVLADAYEGKRLNSPNDLVVSARGGVYFTDPPYGVSPEEKELDINGVYRLDGTGELTLLASDFERPNGLAFSPDESVLYVNDSRTSDIRAFDVQSDGTLANGRIFATMDPPDDSGSADGMVVDADGNVYATGPGGVWIYRPDGLLLDRIETPERVTNAAWGGDEASVLYLTAPSRVFRIQLNATGRR
jgi:gluconolactonase